MSRLRRRRSRWPWVGLLAVAGTVVVVLLFLGRRGPEEALPEPAADGPAIRVEVLNGCGAEGAADRVASLLRRAGYRVERTGNADHFHYREDIVVVRAGDGREAPAMARLLGGAVTVEQRIDAYPYEVSVVVGEPHPLVGKP